MGWAVGSLGLHRPWQQPPDLRTCRQEVTFVSVSSDWMQRFGRRRTGTQAGQCASGAQGSVHQRLQVRFGLWRRTCIESEGQRAYIKYSLLVYTELWECEERRGRSQRQEPPPASAVGQCPNVAWGRGHGTPLHRGPQSQKRPVAGLWPLFKGYWERTGAGHQVYSHWLGTNLDRRGQTRQMGAAQTGTSPDGHESREKE